MQQSLVRCPLSSLTLDGGAVYRFPSLPGNTDDVAGNTSERLRKQLLLLLSPFSPWCITHPSVRLSDPSARSSFLPSSLSHLTTTLLSHPRSPSNCSTRAPALPSTSDRGRVAGLVRAGLTAGARFVALGGEGERARARVGPPRSLVLACWISWRFVSVVDVDVDGVGLGSIAPSPSLPHASTPHARCGVFHRSRVVIVSAAVDGGIGVAASLSDAHSSHVFRPLPVPSLRSSALAMTHLKRSGGKEVGKPMCCFLTRHFERLYSWSENGYVDQIYITAGKQTSNWVRFDCLLFFFDVHVHWGARVFLWDIELLPDDLPHYGNVDFSIFVHVVITKAVKPLVKECKPSFGNPVRFLTV